MAFKNGDLDNLISELTCAKCDKLLSVFPIYTSSSIGNVCGRCTKSIESMISNKSIERNTAYESLAKFLLFPCSHRTLGCNAELKHDEVVNHEECCSFRPRMCPFNFITCDSVLQCDWKGATTFLNTHLDLSHTASEINNPHTFTINMTEAAVKVNFVEVEFLTFVTITRYNGATNKFYCLVMCDEEEICKQYTYQLKVNKEDFHLIYPKRYPEVLIETSEALEKVDKMTVIDLSAVRTLFGNSDSNLICHLSITGNTKIVASTSTTKAVKSIFNEVANPSDAEKKLLQSNKSILKELECPICNNYMKPPIYICVKGHSLCDECKKKVIKCPICRVRAINSRNFTLEKLTEKVVYPCKYSHDGCTEILNVDEIDQHEVNCNLRTDCPVLMLPISCNVLEGILDRISHIYEKHSQDVLNQNEVIRISVSKAKNTNNYNITICDNDIFIVCHRYDVTDNVFKFNILHLGQNQKPYQSKYFEYRLIFRGIVDGSLTVENSCQKVFPCISDGLKYGVIIPKYMLDMSLLGDTLKFRFQIEKKSFI